MTLTPLIHFTATKILYRRRNCRNALIIYCVIKVESACIGHWCGGVGAGARQGASTCMKVPTLRERGVEGRATVGIMYM